MILLVLKTPRAVIVLLSVQLALTPIRTFQKDGNWLQNT
jgi:hypothetical protein